MTTLGLCRLLIAKFPIIDNISVQSVLCRKVSYNEILATSERRHPEISQKYGKVANIRVSQNSQFLGASNHRK